MKREEHLLPSAVESIGSTPLVELTRITRDLDGTILAKLDYLNPGFSGFDVPTTDPPSVAGEAGHSSVLFKEGPVELAPQEIFNGVFMTDLSFGKTGDTEQD